MDLKSVLILSKETRLELAAFQMGRSRLDDTEEALRASKVDVASMRAEHKAHCLSVDQVGEALSQQDIPFRVVPIRQAQNADFANQSLILSLGGDGSFVSCTSHIDDGLPILGVNSNPPAQEGQRIWSVGFYTRTIARDFPARLQCLLQGTGYSTTRLKRMEVRVNDDEKRLLAFAEVYIGHPLRKRNSRHLLEVDGQLEEQSRTSGLIIYPAHAYTAWAGDEGADSPDDPAGIYYCVTGIQRAPHLKLRGGPIHSSLTATSSLTDGVVSIDTWQEFPFLFGHRVEIHRSDKDIHMIEFSTHV